MDVASVPTSRWKLLCYICNQGMGASIQCQHASCYRAYHVTCARRAKLYLSMKVSGSLVLDAGSQVSYCDKHVPSSWRKEHDTDRAILLAQSYYRRTMKGRRWASSQQSALAMLPSSVLQSGDSTEEIGIAEDAQTAAAAKKKQLQAQKSIWRLPSGAPIIPQVVFDSIEMAIARFPLRKRKEFVAEACKYWSLKREARRGAALLKRLQLQMETFSASEITRRDFSAMGPAGRARLQRRIELADQLLAQMEAIQAMTLSVRKREEVKLQDVETLKTVLDTIYFPINALLQPIIEKATQLVQSEIYPYNPKFYSQKPSNDTNGVFTEQLVKIQAKVSVREYTSVDSFSSDMFDVFKAVPGLESVSNLADAYQALEPRDYNLNAEQKETRKLAKRILKAIQPLLADAFRKEAELSKKTYEEELLTLDNPGARAPTKATAGGQKDVNEPQAVNGEAEPDSLPSPENFTIDSQTQTNGRLTPKTSRSAHANGKTQHTKINGHAATDAEVESGDATTRESLPTPTPSEQGPLVAFAHGGIPWYLNTYSPSGTEVQDERWTGGEVLRNMSEQLSEIDEEELKGLSPPLKDAEPAAVGMKEDGSAKKNSPKKKRRSTRGLR